MWKLVVWLVFLPICTVLISLRTTTTVSSNRGKAGVLDFFATPDHWPKIVLSSWFVEGVTDRALKRGDTVREIFGLPPILPLSVEWTCEVNDPNKGILDVRSADGVKGLAQNCRMLFEIQDQDDDRTSVDLTIQYEPQNLLGTLAIPILSLDNWLALQLFFPNELQKRENQWTPLDQFRELMGSLYGIAGVAHLADCLVGPSTLLITSGCSSFYNLPASGQFLALVWCLAGPVSYILSKKAKGDLGMISYGAIEVGCAAVILATNSSPESMEALKNAILVQVVVALAWIYSSQQPIKTDEVI